MRATNKQFWRTFSLCDFIEIAPGDATFGALADPPTNDTLCHILRIDVPLHHNDRNRQEPSSNWSNFEQSKQVPYTFGYTSITIVWCFVCRYKLFSFTKTIRFIWRLMQSLNWLNVNNAPSYTVGYSSITIVGCFACRYKLWCIVNVSSIRFIGSNENEIQNPRKKKKQKTNETKHVQLTK